MALTDFEAPAAVTETLENVTQTVSKWDDLSKRLVQAMLGRKLNDPRVEAPDPEVFQKAAVAYWNHAMREPLSFMAQQAAFWGQTAMNIVDTQAHALTFQAHRHDETDRRFSNPVWDANPYLHMVMEQYRINARALEAAVDDAEDLDPREKQKLAFFAEQIVNLTAPNNFLPMNPDALERAIETEGASLLQGLENFVNDLEASDGDLLVKLADDNAFTLGENIATTPGEVIFRNRMIELIQYKPSTETVHETPIVLFPPWINKFYILDLKEKNSLIKWITGQGYTLFVVSWVNPDESFADAGLEDYIEEGYLPAIAQAKAVCGVDQVNAVGYCIAGTTLHLTLALMKKRGDTSVKSATFFTTLTDFSDQGEFTPFLQDDFIDGIEAEVDQAGVLDGRILSRTFSFLRSNDLVYGPAIRSYMLGETPPAFDLLYWNGDGTNLPGKMSVQYLRDICQRNALADGGLELCGETLSLADVDVPLIAITCETDHIARWKDCYRGFQQVASEDKTFVVSESGHIAGIVNPPSKGKYGHFLNSATYKPADDWMAGATYTEGSWWPMWETWLAERSGEMVPARDVAPALGAAPGSYVSKKIA